MASDYSESGSHSVMRPARQSHISYRNSCGGSGVIPVGAVVSHSSVRSEEMSKLFLLVMLVFVFPQFVKRIVLWDSVLSMWDS